MSEKSKSVLCLVCDRRFVTRDRKMVIFFEPSYQSQITNHKINII